MDKKIIAFDAKRAAQNRTGLGNYSRFIVRLLSLYAPDNDYRLFVPDLRKTRFLDELPTPSAYTIVSPRTVLGRAMKALWRSFAISHELRRQHVDLYHGLSNELPFGIRHAGCRSIVTIHDVIFLHHPEYYHPLDRWLYRLKFAYAGRKADCVLTVSEYSKRELVQHLHLPPSKIHVVYQGITIDFSSVTDTDLRRVQSLYRLPDRFILFVGTLEERKNLLLVARAFVLLAAKHSLPPDLRLVAVGRRTPYLSTVLSTLQAAGLTDRLLICEGVPFADLPAFYRLADFFVYPSRIEGFGIPMLEAAAAGLPAIGCTGSSLEEAGGAGAFYVDPDDAPAMAQCILSLWNNADLRKERSVMGLSHAERFSDSRLFSDLMAVYDSLIC